MGEADAKKGGRVGIKNERKLIDFNSKIYVDCLKIKDRNCQLNCQLKYAKSG